MRRVGVEEAATVSAEHLDGDLRGGRADGDGLPRLLERGRVHVGAQRLRNALPDEEERIDDADGQQHVQRAPCRVDPEVANRVGRCTRKAANERNREHDAGGCRHEVLHRQTEHLHEVGHRAFAAVVLPVGVGGEAHGSVEGEVGRHSRLASRIEWQRALQAQERIEQQEACQIEQQHGHRIGEPMLLAFGVDAGDGIEGVLDRL